MNSDQLPFWHAECEDGENVSRRGPLVRPENDADRADKDHAIARPADANELAPSAPSRGKTVPVSITKGMAHPLPTIRFRLLWSQFQKGAAALVGAVGADRDIDWESLSFSNILKNLIERVSHHDRNSSSNIYRHSFRLFPQRSDNAVPKDVQHFERTLNQPFETDEYLPPKEFEQPDEIRSLYFETDEHVQPKVFEEPEQNVQNIYDDDDLMPPHEVDEYVPVDVDRTDEDEGPDHDLCDRALPSVSETKRQPATDIRFKHAQIGDDHEITTDWRPYKSAAERTRLTVISRSLDLRCFTKIARLEMERFRKRGEGKYSLNDWLPGDKWSAGGRKLQVAVRSMMAAASVACVPDEAVLFVTINHAATPGLPTWEEAGGPGPMEVMEDACRLFRMAVDEVASMHVLCEGYFESAQAVNAADENERCAEYAKAYAQEHWPEGLSWDDHSDAIFVGHTHRIVVLVDENGQFIEADRFREALKRQFPLPRAVRVETPRDTRWGPPDASTAEKVAAFMRYNICKKRKLTEAEVLENLRWTEKLKPEHIFFSGWTSYSEVRPIAVPIMRASLIGRHKLQEALTGFDIGPARRVEISPEVAQLPVEAHDADRAVLRLDDYRNPPSSRAVRSTNDVGHLSAVVLPITPTSPRNGGWHPSSDVVQDVGDLEHASRRRLRLVALNDKHPEQLPVGARAGPVRRAA